MCVPIYILVCILNVSSALQIKYFTSENKAIVNISNIDITKNSLDDKISWLYVLKYDEGDEQVEAISDLPDLEHIDIYNIGQEVIPTFKNLPKIRHISIKGNQISFIKTEALGTIPLQEFFLTHNQITTIERNAFGPNVTILYLSCNNLSKILPRWFQNPAVLEELDIAGNQITSLQEDLFKNFTELQQIVLSHNEIKTIGAGALSNRNSFFTLYLSNNLLTELPANIFKPGDIEIRSIHLQYNKLTFLSEEFLKKTNNTKARIYGNPWQCSCWDIIRQWNTWVNYEYNKEPEGLPRCVTPLSFQSACIPIVDYELIEYYEKNAPEKETTQEFCKSYLQ